MPCGQEMSKAVESAVRDISAQQQGVPLAKSLGDTRAEIACADSAGFGVRRTAAIEPGLAAG